MKTKSLFYLLVICCLCCLFGKNPIFANEFLRIGNSARAMGMGEASVAFAEDVNVMNYNPAGLANLKKNEISLMHLKYFDDFSYEYAAYAQRLSNLGVLGVNARFLHYPEFTWIDENGEEVGSIGGSWMALTIGLGGKFSILKNDFGGLNVKFVNAKYADYSSMSTAIDIGLMTLEKTEFLIFGDLKTGIAIRDLGINFKPAGEKAEKLPARLGIGFSVNVLNKEGLKDKHALYLATEVLVKMVDRADTKIHLGLEYSIMKMLYLRAGYKMNYEAVDLVFGGGANINVAQLTKTSLLADAQIDYAFVPAPDLGHNHIVSIRARFPGEYKEKEIEEEFIEEEIEEEVIEEVIEEPVEEVIEEEVIEEGTEGDIIKEEGVEEEVIEEEVIEEEVIEE